MQWQFPKFDKKILICVSGSISVYKALDLISSLKKLGADVRVVLSDGAKKFINKIAFEAISQNEVLDSSNEDWSKEFSLESNIVPCNHISYARWADVCLIAPASANTICKFANGYADNLITQTLLATTAPILIAPAMNTNMLNSPQVKEALNKLESRAKILDSRIARLVCGINGNGALLENEKILIEVLKAGLESSFWQNKQVIITGGGAKEKIDSVRCITNNSSGAQSLALALALYTLGAKVHLIASFNPPTLPNNMQFYKAESNKDFKEKIENILDSSNEDSFLFSAAAMADFKVESSVKGKIKKEEFNNELKLIKNIDVLKEINNKSLIKIGFKLESNKDISLDSAKKMLDSLDSGGKECSFVCLNVIKENLAIFGEKENEITILSKSKNENLGVDSKINLAYKIAKFIENNI